MLLEASWLASCQQRAQIKKLDSHNIEPLYPGLRYPIDVQDHWTLECKPGLCDTANERQN
jgi:hypothetical protein